jgi:glutamate racemase
MNRPIGIFDSGIGGLTVARAVKDLLPQETIVYFGDVANLPYGEKSTTSILAYVIQICDLLLQHQCKVILMACNSASTVAYELASAHVGNKAVVLNVIDPFVDYVGSQFSGQSIALIATQRTVQSGVYEKKLQALSSGIILNSLATPRLIPMIEASFSQGIDQPMINHYLQHAALQEISALVLGCTHYAIIKKEIQAFYADSKPQVAVVDASEIIARYVNRFLTHHQLLCTSRQAKDYFMTSAMTASFEGAVYAFFGREVKLTRMAAPREDAASLGG